MDIPRTLDIRKLEKKSQKLIFLLLLAYFATKRNFRIGYSVWKNLGSLERLNVATIRNDSYSKNLAPFKNFF